MDFLRQPWPWYFSGPMIALVMFLLLWTGKSFGMSSNLRTFCAALGAGKKVSFFAFDWKAQRWNLMVALGAVVGGFIAANYLSVSTAVAISENTVAQLQQLGIQDAGQAYMPQALFDSNAISNPKSLLILTLGGFFVGFGARYAGGCTSGHAISGLSNFQLPSLIAVIGFFIGGLFVNHFLLPFLL
ncbi:MAG: YeeE/YedE family protein [Flavobacteriaceae bacterium]